jgi:hypothetical protein
MHRYEFKVGPYSCVPFGHAAVGGLFTGAVRVSRRLGDKIATEIVQYSNRTFHAESDAREYAKQRFKAAAEHYVPRDGDSD